MIVADGMNTFLQLLGSLASVAAIPLSVYLYLRSREARVTQIRREIAKILSYQVGEGRRLSTFELQAVIDSKVRESGIRSSSITPDQMIEDLVAETITNPMLESKRKADIIHDLQWMYRHGAAIALITRYPVALSDVLALVSRHHPVDQLDSDMVESFGASAAEPPTPRNEVSRVGTLSSLFAFLALAITVVSYYLTELTTVRNVVGRIQLPALQFLLGLVSSLVASVLAVVLIRWAKPRVSSTQGSDARKAKDHGGSAKVQ